MLRRTVTDEGSPLTAGLTAVRTFVILWLAAEPPRLPCTLQGELSALLGSPVQGELSSLLAFKGLTEGLYRRQGIAFTPFSRLPLFIRGAERCAQYALLRRLSRGWHCGGRFRRLARHSKPEYAARFRGKPRNSRKEALSAAAERASCLQ